ncbi:MAG: NAD(P)H-dependent oxidoreductase [Coriobacteriales bacterium]|nr:NAD(P)H-dependent oxidoreductase [Coriobacteriales bacterium]
MAVLFVNACMREESRTERIARAWLESRGDEFDELDLGRMDVSPLDADSIVAYNQAVASADYAHPMFDVAKQFAAAEEILIAAPVWNYAIPAKLHDYLELVCSQGVTFDMAEDGSYVSLCHAKRLTFVTTAGGPLPQGTDDHAFGYLRTLSDAFWHIPDVQCVYADSLDMLGVDVDEKIEAAIERAAL